MMLRDAHEIFKSASEIRNRRYFLLREGNIMDGEKKGECYALLNHLDSQEKLAIDYDG